MDKYISAMPRQARAILELQNLYETNGFLAHRVARFEEHSFYSDNRSFISDNRIITFNNTHGQLLALKPDITLSVAKSAPLTENFTKLYYNEHVYRISPDSDDFDEVPQCGVEMYGDLDGYATYEIVALAAQSLHLLDENFSLVISHLAWLQSILHQAQIPEGSIGKFITCVKNKNSHQLAELCVEYGLSPHLAVLMNDLVSVQGSFGSVLPRLEAMQICNATTAAYTELVELWEVLSASPHGSKIFFDFSVVSHLDYYNGLVFRGYIQRSPYATLSGGRYDMLMKKLRGVSTGAVGFAVYLDKLNLYYSGKREHDFDAVILYDATAKTADIAAAKEQLIARGLTVRVERGTQPTVSAREVYRVGDGGIKN